MFLSPSTHSTSAEFDVGGVDDAPCLIGIGNDLEGGATTALLVYGQVAELVDDEKSGLADARRVPGQAGSPAGRGADADSPVAVKRSAPGRPLAGR